MAAQLRVGMMSPTEFYRHVWGFPPPFEVGVKPAPKALETCPCCLNGRFHRVQVCPECLGKGLV